MRLIDADVAIDTLKELTANGTNKGMVFGEDAVHRIEMLPSVQPFHIITMTEVLKYIDDMPEDVWQEFTACLECRGWELQWCGGDFT